MNYLWACMILIGIVYGAFHGTLPDITVAALDSAKEAITLCITMMGVMSFWVGIMKIAEKAGAIEGAAKKMAPCLAFLFPGIPRDHPANRYIAANMIANIFGLGWAATPAGLKAMEQLENLEEERRAREGSPAGLCPPEKAGLSAAEDKREDFTRRFQEALRAMKCAPFLSSISPRCS